MSMWNLPSTIECKYSCAECGIVRAIVKIKARGVEDVREWMDKTAIPTLMRDHYERSPGCATQEFSEVMIPMTGASKIGGPVEN